MKTYRVSQRFHGCLLTGAVSLIALLAVAPNAWPCTAFLQEGLLMGRNLDWNNDQGLLLVNKKGVSKRAMVLDPTEKTAQWVSQYGSLTFNQYGRELPTGGMNEAGLVVETLWLDATRHPQPDERAGLDFSTKTPVQMISINTARLGVLNPYFSDYGADVNRWMIYYSVRHTPELKDVPDMLIEAFARYPDLISSK